MLFVRPTRRPGAERPRWPMDHQVNEWYTVDKVRTSGMPWTTRVQGKRGYIMDEANARGTPSSASADR